jgi:hypothetical protein
MAYGAPAGSLAPIVFTVLIIGVALLLFLVMPIIQALRATRRGDWAYLYHGFIAAFLLVCPLGLIVCLEYAGQSKPFGAVLTVLSSGLLLIARVGEARAVSRSSWRRTLWGLLTLRLDRWALPPGHCVICGYNLFGLTEPRCPECGRPFDPTES